jgi:CBS domain-containing protein
VRPRVFFGDDWVRSSVLEILRDDITHFRVVLPVPEDEPWPRDVLDRGGVPNLKALALHNGTIYRWNRPCYGVSDGKATLRIENRPLPAGPSVVDSIANAAFLFGLTLGLAREYGNVGRRMPFHDAQANFYNAASNGLRAALHWMDARTRPADELILLVLPLAAQGLEASGVDPEEAHRYLDIITERVASGQTGARWQLEGYNRMRTFVPQDEALQGLVTAYVARQRSGQPVHTWAPAAPPDREQRRAAYERVGQVMRRDIPTVHEEDSVSLAEAVMRWEGVRHVPVENDAGELVGLCSVRDLLLALKKGGEDVGIRDVMTREVQTVEPETRTVDAIKRMQEHKLACLPVVRAGKLVGMLTESDLVTVAGRLLE